MNQKYSNILNGRKHQKNNQIISGDLVKVSDNASRVILTFFASFDSEQQTRKKRTLEISPGEIGMVVDSRVRGTLREFLLLFGDKIGWTTETYFLEKIETDWKRRD